MPQKTVLILNGHPGQTSLSKHFTQVYADAAATQGHDVRQYAVSDMHFDVDFGQGSFRGSKPLEPVLEAFWGDLSSCDHFVCTAPMWWGNLPAKTRGLFDRVLLPGRAFDTSEMKMGLPKPMLTGKSARFIITADTPQWALRVFYGMSIQRNIRAQIMGYVGIKPTKFSYFAPASKASSAQVAQWSNIVAKLGASAT